MKMGIQKRKLSIVFLLMITIYFYPSLSINAAFREITAGSVNISNVETPEGEHRNKVEKDEYISFTNKKIGFKFGKRIPIYVDLNWRTHLNRRLYVNAQLENAMMKILNISLAFYQGIKLDVGRYNFEISEDGYNDKILWIKRGTGETKKLEIHSDNFIASQQSKRITNSLGMEFVYIQPGTFMMGSLSDEACRNDDETKHQVTLTKGFYMQTTEVTQGQWKAVMGSNPSWFKKCGDDCPVEQVSWHDVQEFINKLNQREGKVIYRLPTEAEWEYAARAGSTTAFANGDISELDCEENINLNAMGWYKYNSDEKTHPVAQKQPNAWGLFDMHGNVYEWCQDRSDVEMEKYSTGPVTNPTGLSDGRYRVARGGHYFEPAGECRLAHRNRGSSNDYQEFLGFRVIRTP